MYHQNNYFDSEQNKIITQRHRILIDNVTYKMAEYEGICRIYHNWDYDGGIPQYMTERTKRLGEISDARRLATTDEERTKLDAAAEAVRDEFGRGDPYVIENLEELAKANNWTAEQKAEYESKEQIRRRNFSEEMQRDYEEEQARKEYYDSWNRINDPDFEDNNNNNGDY